MRIDVITLFPEILRGGLDCSILKRAQKKGLVHVHLHQLRDYALDKHRTVDDRPFGGGPGMLLKCEPLFRAYEAVKAMGSDTAEPGAGVDVGTSAEAAAETPVDSVEGEGVTATGTVKASEPTPTPTPVTRTILFSAGGKLFNQAMAREWSKVDRLIFICGHYEGVDERVREALADEEISIGNYVLTNGALPALVVIDAVVRLIPNAVGNAESTESESFSFDPADGGGGSDGEGGESSGHIVEWPQYTRPEDFRGSVVPRVLLDGNHAEIARWRRAQAAERTRRNRSDLLPPAPPVA
ncbi:tRNA (guanosine(37)-N1)-methyltransferase TrmD [Verrucomicrobia bacterium LW23]|nr:tRNA (guanosine(37)-N1)-methyltransferase TrmD [Verrucomicrobia bacterium LW23]